MAAKLLIVDDSATDRLIIKNMLSHYDVLTACDGQEALRVIDEQKDIDLIILDLNMPVMDGFEVLKALRAMDSNKRMRTIILTNYDELDKEIRGLQEGAVDFIRKPVNMESLRVRTGIHLELLRLQRLYEKALTQSRSTLNALLDGAHRHRPVPRRPPQQQPGGSGYLQRHLRAHRRTQPGGTGHTGLGVYHPPGGSGQGDGLLQALSCRRD